MTIHQQETTIQPQEGPSHPYPATMVLRGAIIALLLPLISACGSDVAVRGDLVKGNVEIAKEQTRVSSLPLLEYTTPVCYPDFIPDSGGGMVFRGMKCASSTLLVRNPNGGSATSQVSTPRDTQAELGIAAIGAAGTALNFGIGGWAASELTKNATKGVIEGINSVPTSNVNNISDSFNSLGVEE